MVLDRGQQCDRRTILGVDRARDSQYPYVVRRAGAVNYEPLGLAPVFERVSYSMPFMQSDAIIEEPVNVDAVS